MFDQYRANRQFDRFLSSHRDIPLSPDNNPYLSEPESMISEIIYLWGPDGNIIDVKVKPLK